jgi:hypothetical protein
MQCCCAVLSQLYAESTTTAAAVAAAAAPVVVASSYDTNDDPCMSAFPLACTLMGFLSLFTAVSSHYYYLYSSRIYQCIPASSVRTATALSVTCDTHTGVLLTIRSNTASVMRHA